MSLGTSYNNNAKNEARNDYNFSSDSYYKFYNAESSVDKTAVKFSFWNNMLKVVIAPKSKNNATNNGDAFSTFDWTDGTTCAFITPIKAKMLHDEIEKFQNNPEGYTNVGIPLGASGNGIIYICNGKEFGINNPCMVIITVNNEGDAESTAVYEFKTQYNFAIRNYDVSNKNFERVFYDTIELDTFKVLLQQYYEAMSGAIAYSVINTNMRNNVRVKKSLEAIASKVGADLGYGNSNYGSSRRTGSSFFNNSNTGNSKPEPLFQNTTLEDLE